MGQPMTDPAPECFPGDCARDCSIAPPFRASLDTGNALAILPLLEWGGVR